MCENGESRDIRWQLITASPDMMDVSQGNASFPFLWRSSLALYAAPAPEEEGVSPHCGKKIAFLKVTASITGYQPSKEETERGYVEFPQVPVEELDLILREYFACYGVLLQVAVFPRDAEVPIEQYPRIINFEPKTRDLYQTASESGELLSASRSGVKTDRSLTSTEPSETGFDMSTLVKFPLGEKGEGQVGGKLSHKWGDTVQDKTTVTADASRERKETTGTKTEISQMYNLLTGYHPGTNRVSFLLLPRPHMLQPTDHRTFIQGLRIIEGVQEFFLVVEYPAEMQSFCVEMKLDTGHFPENVTVEQPEEQYETTTADFRVEAYADNGFFSGDTKRFEYTFQAPSGWVIDMTKGDEGHPGCSEIANESNAQANSTLREYKYGAVNDTAIVVSGQITGASWFGPGAIFKRVYRAFLRSVDPIPPTGEPAVTTPFLITSRSLHACVAQQNGCFSFVPPPAGFMVDHGEYFATELEIPIDRALLTRSAMSASRTPLLKHLIHEISKCLLRHSRLRQSYPFGEVGFLESEYFLHRIMKVLPERPLKTPIGKVVKVPAAVRKHFGEELPAGDFLKMDHRLIADRCGVAVKEIAELKRKLLSALFMEGGEKAGK